MELNNNLLQGQLTLFDYFTGIHSEEDVKEPIDIKKEEKSFDEMLKEMLIRYGTGFAMGKYRVHKIIQRNDLSEKEKIATIKSEFGCGGWGRPAEPNIINNMNTFGSKMVVSYMTECGIKEVSLNWNQIYKYIKSWDMQGEYFNSFFEPMDVIISDHSYCNDSLYLEISKESTIYKYKNMSEKNLYIVYKNHRFSMESFTHGNKEIIELTSDEQYILSEIGHKYGWADGRGGIWNLCQEIKTA